MRGRRAVEQLGEAARVLLDRRVERRGPLHDRDRAALFDPHRHEFGAAAAGGVSLSHLRGLWDQNFGGTELVVVRIRLGAAGRFAAAD